MNQLFISKNIGAMKILLLATILLLSTGLDEPGYVKTKIGKNIELELPVVLAPMSKQDRSEKVNSPREAIALYTTPDRRTDFAINTSSTSWEKSDFDLMKDFYKSSLYGLFSEVEIITEEVREIHKQKFAILEFISLVSDDNVAFTTGRVVKKYNYIQYCLIGTTTYVFTLNSPANEKGYWQPIARRIMDSIKIK